MGESVIYADVYAMVNFGMDFIALVMSGRLLSRRIRLGRVLGGAAVGAIYGAILLFCGAGRLLSGLTLLPAAAAMCFAAYRSRTVGCILSEIAAYIGISLLLGGAISALGAFLPRSAEPSPGTFSVLALAGAAVTMAAGILIVRRRTEKTAVVEWKLAGRHFAAVALVDSGNLLRDPISGKSAVILSARFLPEELRDTAHLPAELRTRFRLVPHKTVGGGGMLTAFRPEELRVGGHERDALVAFDLDTESYGEHDGIVPSSLV